MKTYLVQALVTDGPVASLVNRRLCETHLKRLGSDNVFNIVPISTICDICVQTKRDDYENYRHANRGWLTMIRSAATVYIAGPMTGFLNFNKESFVRMEHLLKSEGFKVLSPAHWEGGKDYSWYMQQDIQLLLSSSAVVMLVGWQDSKGAVVEHTVAMTTGKQVCYEFIPHRMEKQGKRKVGGRHQAVYPRRSRGSGQGVKS